MPTTPCLDLGKKSWLIVLDIDGDVVFQGGSLPFTKYQLEKMVENCRLGYSFPGALMAKLQDTMTVIYPPDIDIYVLLERFQDVVGLDTLNENDFMHRSQELHSLLCGEEPKIKWRDEQIIRITEEYSEERMRGKVIAYNGTFPCALDLEFLDMPSTAFINSIISTKGTVQRGTTTLAKYQGIDWKDLFFRIYFTEERSAWRVEFIKEVEWLQVYFTGASFTNRSLYPNNLNSTLSVETGKGCTWTITNGKHIYEFQFQEANPLNSLKLSWKVNDTVAQVSTNWKVYKSSVGCGLILKNI